MNPNTPPKKLKPSFFIWLSATLLCMAGIFIFSSFGAEESSMQSLFITQLLFGDDSYDEPVRVFAHFLSFTILGVCAVNTLKHLLHGIRLFSISLCISTVYAALDELHQHFVPGRAMQVSDWAVDTAGALLGIAVSFLVWRLTAQRSSHC